MVLYRTAASRKPWLKNNIWNPNASPLPLNYSLYTSAEFMLSPPLLATDKHIHHTHTHTQQSQGACALSRHYEPSKQSSWSGKQAIPHSKWCKHPKSHLTIEKRPWIWTPSKCQVTNTTAGWTARGKARKTRRKEKSARMRLDYRLWAKDTTTT